jgi:hypothetical protein
MRLSGQHPESSEAVKGLAADNGYEDILEILR